MITETIFTSWITYFGAPGQFFSDNGGEFNNEVMRMMGDLYNIRMLCTAAESPWSNGACERLNGVLSLSTQRVLEDMGCSMEIALAWSVATRNTLHNFSGYSPAQLVFGLNPTFPNVVESNPPGLENVSNSHIVAQNLNAMHSARKEFVKSEYDERIRRALLHQVREDDAKDISMGDSVYFKRQDNKWHGPGKVIGRDGKQILVKHGGAVIRAHTFRIQGCAPQASVAADRGDAENNATVRNSQLDSDEEDSAPRPQIIESTEVNSNSNGEVSANASNEAPDEGDGSATDGFLAPTGNMKPPRIGDRIEFIDKNGEKNVAKVTSRAGKSTGIYKFCFNIEESNGQQKWIDLYRDVDKWRSLPNDEEVFVTYNSDAVESANRKELAIWQENKVFDSGQKTISLRWAITEKLNEKSEPII